MKTRCPACGAVASLDVLIEHDAARDAVRQAFALSDPLGKALVRYLGLFRPPARELTFTRVAGLLSELLPDIDRGRITRSGREWPAPRAAWIGAIEVVVAAPNLKRPLKSHGYLYEVIAGQANGAEAKAEAEAEQKRAYAFGTERQTGPAQALGTVLERAAAPAKVERTPMPEAVGERLAALGLRKRPRQGDHSAAD